MKFCLRSRLSPRFLAKADEIRVDYRDKATIPDLSHTYPDKTIILFPPTDSLETYNWDEMVQYNLLCNSNFVLNLNTLDLAPVAKERGIKFMINTEATSYWELEGLVKLGAEYAYVGIPLFFDLDNASNYDIKLRAVPTVAYNHSLPHDNGICGQWIRPEDVDTYADYIDVLEFEPCEVTREQTLFKVYAEDKAWSTRLDILVPDLGSPAINRMITPDIITARLHCRQHCKSNRACHICEMGLKLATPDYLPREIKETIEK